MERKYRGDGKKAGFFQSSRKETDRKQRIIEGLLDTEYKIFAMIIEEKLRKETERLGFLPETQAGFRKRRSGIDNIYILKTAAEKEINKKNGKLYVFFEGSL